MTSSPLSPALQSGPFAQDNNRLQFAMKAAGIGIWEMDTATTKIIWDERCRELFGLAKDNVLSYEEAMRFIHPDDVDEVNDKVQAALRGENGGQYNATYRTIGADDGKLRWVNFTGAAYFGEGSRVRRFGGVAQEVTDITIALQQKQEGEAYQKALVNLVPAMIFYLDEEQRYTSYNDTFMEWFGVNATEALGKTFREFVGEAAYAAIQPYLSKAYEGERQQFEMRSPTRLKPNRWLSVVYTPHRPKDGRAIGVIAHMTDITESKEDKEALAFSERKYRSLLNTMEQGFCIIEMVFDVEGKAVDYIFREINPAFEKQAALGNPVGRRMRELAPNHEEEWFRTYGEVVKTGNSVHFIQQAAHIGGYVYEVFAMPAGQPGSNQVAVLFNDITERTQSFQKLAAAQASLRGAIEVANLGTFDVDVAAGTITVSQRTADWFGFDELTKPVDTFIGGVTEAQQEYIRNSLQEAMDPVTGGRYEVEHGIVNAKTGQETIIRALSQVYFNAERQPIRVHGIAVDITDLRNRQSALEEDVRRRNEELAAAAAKLRLANNHLTEANERLSAANQELMRSNHHLEEFAHAASHDLKEPIRKIHFFTAQLKEQLGEHLAENQRRSFGRIENATQRMGSLIDDLLIYSHVTQRPHQKEPVNMNEAAKHVLEDLELDIQESNAVIHVAELPTVQGYRRQLQQLFQNLISNALKYVAPGTAPHIEITSCNAEREGKPYCCFSVADQGIGFAQEYTEKIFQMFARLHGKQEYSGTGVGLSIVKKVVENHDGFIEVESVPGKGATFKVYLPVI